MKKIFLFLILVLCSLTWLNCKVTILNKSETSNFKLSLVLKYHLLGTKIYSYFYYKLAKNESKSFDFKINSKNLEEIKVYKWITSDPFEDGSQTSLVNWVGRKALSSQEKIKDDATYWITSNGENWAQVGTATP